MASSIFEHVLVPYDGSKFSKKAMNTAIQVSDRLESKIHLLSVINLGYIKPPGSLLGLVGGKPTKAILKQLAQKARRETEVELRAHVLRCKKQGRAADYHISTGNISEEILKFAKKKKITLIIIGSQGLHGIGKFKALGSVSRKVSEFASCPVLIVR